MQMLVGVGLGWVLRKKIQLSGISACKSLAGGAQSRRWTHLIAFFQVATVALEVSYDGS